MARYKGIDYRAYTANAIELAIERAIGSSVVDPLRIVIDGLNQTGRKTMKGLLKHGSLRPKDVRGARDESEALIRVADSVCGLCRDSYNLSSPLHQVWLNAINDGFVIQSNGI